MEAAAKSIELLSQRILPQNPHHLSYFHEWRYRQPTDNRRRFEEWHSTRLQYLTLISEADRGVVLTRSDYDMREEPPKPVSRDIATLSSKGGEKKKLSLSDYKNKKTSGATPASPPEPAASHKHERPAIAAPHPPAASADSRSGSDSHGPSKSRPDGSRPRDRDSSATHDAKQSRAPNVVDMRLPPKPPTKASLPPKPPSPDSKKRGAEYNDEPRPQKRPKPDSGRSGDDRLQTSRDSRDGRDSRDEAQRRKDRDLPSTRDPISQKNARSLNSPSLPNGRNVLKGASSSNNAASPVSRSRGDSINGGRPPASGNTKTTPSKSDATKHLPPLLSPLRLDLDHREKEAASREERKKRDDDREATRAPKPKKLEPPSASSSKKPKSPLRLLPLLSPTLPPEVEAELQKRKNKTGDSESREDKPSASSNARKGPVVDHGDDDSSDESTHPKRTFVITLKIPKRLRPSVRRILALSVSKKDALERESVEPAPQARKRPAGASETIVDSIDVKRPRTSDISSSAKLPAPATPSKKGTAMSRVSSSNSQAHTPGEMNMTPSASNSIDRAFNGLDPPKGGKADITAMRERETRMSNLGRKLKHNADIAMKGRHGPHTTNGSGRPSESSIKLGYVLALEGIIAFMASFQAQNMHRSMSNKACDPHSWASLFPLMEFHQKEMRRLDARRFQPLYALLLLLQAVSIDEVLKCYGTFENPGNHVSVQELIKHERTRSRVWPQIREANSRIESSSLRVDINPWSTADEVTEMALRIMRRWSADENVDWTPEVNLKEPSSRGPSSSATNH